MKMFIGFVSLLFFLGCAKQTKIDEERNPEVTAFVNPFMGTIEGNIFPGVSVPFGMVKLGPDNLPPQSTSGYRPGRPIAGFSHLHTSGTGGGPRYGNIMVIPQTGTPDLKGYASVKQVNERAHPGYYSVTLARKRGDVAAALTATAHVGYHKYEFFTWTKDTTIQGSLFFDVAHTLTRGGLADSRCLEAHVEIVSDHQLQGWAEFAGGWGGQNPYKVFFVAETDTPHDRYGVWTQEGILANESVMSTVFDEAHPVLERRMGAWLGFDLVQHQTVELRVAVSFKDLPTARANLAEVSGQSFDDVYARSNALWNQQLSTIEVSGGWPAHKQVFYSALRNTFLMPTDVSGQVAGWDTLRAHYWDHYCIWDVFRTVMPLHTLIAPDRQREILNSLLDIYDKKGWLPDAWVAGDFAEIQGGTNVDVVFADGVVKALGGFDVHKALAAVRKHAETESDSPQIYGRFLNDYLKLGYVTSETHTGATSRSLEYAYNDFCIAQIAGTLGEKDLQRTYLERSQRVFTLFHDSAGHFWAKDREANWMPGVTPENVRKDHWNDPYFYEATPLIYSSYVPHDMQGLINRHGGSEAYVAYLDHLFYDKRVNMGNEPLFLLPYQYIFAGRHDKTAEIIQKLMRRDFLSATDGLPGQDDSGAISSWFVFSSMGFFPVAGQDLYLVGSPLFSHSKIRLENQQYFEVVAHNLSHENIYVQHATLNGKPLNQAWFRHHEIARGGKLILHMGPDPMDWGNGVLPPSISIQ